MHAVKGDGFTSRPGSSSGGGIGPGGAMRGSRSGSTLGSRGAASEGGMGEQMGAARLVDIGYARMEPHERAVGASGTKLKPPPPLLSRSLPQGTSR
jgi:hypothetical protein